MLKSKKKLLHIIPYAQFVPPKNGGALRCYHLCVELAKHFDVTLITLQPADEIDDDNFKNITILNPTKPLKLKGLKHKLVNAIKYRWYQRTLKGPAEATVLQFYPVLKKLSKTEAFDYVLLEHLSSMALGKAIKKWWPSALRIVDQHNIDHLLYQQGHDLGQTKHKKTFDRLKYHETHIYNYADCFLGCSNHDVLELQRLNSNKIKGIAVPNGTTQKTSIQKDFSVPTLIFCGSLDYTPNKNGLLWFYDSIWPELKAKIPEVKLTVVGRNGNDKAYDTLKDDPQIDFIGEVDDVTPYYQNSSIAIVPLLEGSGTRLKILEAMSFGLPVVSTSIGAEGINTINNTNILIADDYKKFNHCIVESLSNTKKLKSLALQGYKLVQKEYNWKYIVEVLHLNLCRIK